MWHRNNHLSEIGEQVASDYMMLKGLRVYQDVVKDTRINLNECGLYRSFVAHWNVEWALLRPEGITVNS